MRHRLARHVRRLARSVLELAGDMVQLQQVAFEGSPHAPTPSDRSYGLTLQVGSDTLYCPSTKNDYRVQ